MAMIRVMIIDDERPARQKIRHYLQSEPDLVFLDVQMPGLDGFGVLEALDFEPLPQIVFVTAHDHFALRAFEVHALDYLLKPFDPGRFEKVLDRARAFIKRGADESENVGKLLEELRGRPRHIERLLIHCEDRAFFLRVDQIQWIESAKNYVRLHVDKNVYSMRGTIERLNR